MNSVSRPIRKETSLLLDWYDANARELPWRIPPGSSRFADPYHVWLSEIMLQQTQVKTVEPYYHNFLELWPTLTDMAAADLEDVLKAWAGLGYYSRARNLKKCADLITTRHNGHFPATANELLKLPGIGPYTSAAISAIAYGEPVAVVDGNVERVVSRYYAIDTPLPRAKIEISKNTQALVPELRAGDFAQAMMDLGATVCTPKKPNCAVCPWQYDCMARANKQQMAYPVKPLKMKIPTRHGAAFVALSDEGYILLRKRGEIGMLAGMSEVPTTDWSSQNDGATGIDAAPFVAEWAHSGNVSHVFTHFKLEMKVYFCRTLRRADVEGWWVHKECVMGEALPELMKKAIRMAIDKRE